jgi:hypothetical protein
MSREAHVRFYEGLGVEFPRPTHPLYCTRNQKGNFRVGLRTEKSRLRRALQHAQDLMRRMRHLPDQCQLLLPVGDNYSCRS